MAYSKQTWSDGKAGATPVNAARLQNIENGLALAGQLLGSGTAFPSSGIQAGDVFLRTDIGTNGTLFQFTGNTSNGSAGWIVESAVTCTSTTRPTSALYAGMQIYETDTTFVWEYNGSAWLPISPGACMGKLWCTSGSSGSMNATQEYPLIPLSGQRLSGGMTATSTQLTLPLDGLYDIWGSWYYTNAAAGFVNGWIVRNRAAATANICIVGAQYKANSGYDLQAQSMNRSVPLKAGDKLSLSTYSYTAGVAWFGSNESQGTMFSAAWVGPLNGATPF